jgi:uncharacterized protein (DUF1697 family)
MPVRIALFRGINVGGRKILRMQELKSLLESLGCTDVKTYIQSGNVVFSHVNPDDTSLSDAISSTIESKFGFLPIVLLLPASELRRAVTENPFADAVSEPKTLHLWFLSADPANPDLTSIEALKTEGESFALKERRFYLHAPKGIGRSKLAAAVEKLLGVPATARNWRTVTKILELSNN